MELNVPMINITNLQMAVPTIVLLCWHSKCHSVAEQYPCGTMGHAKTRLNHHNGFIVSFLNATRGSRQSVLLCPHLALDIDAHGPACIVHK